MMAEVDCHLDEIYLENRLESKPLSMSVSKFLNRVNWGRKSHLKCRQRHFRDQGLRVNRKEKASQTVAIITVS